ncbi:MAG: S8 family peptidase [Pseudomonadota bacterium]
MAALIGASPLIAPAAAPQLPAPGDAEILIGETDRIIVKYKDGKSAGKHGRAHVPAMSAARMAILQRSGQQFGVALKALHGNASGANIVQIGKRMAVADVAALARELQARDPNVEYAEPDRIMVAQYTPNDPRYGEQWHYFESTGGLRANLAWDVVTGTGVKVAVIDTGYRPHADLAGQFVGGYDFITSAEMGADGNGRDSDASDPGDSTISGQCGAGSAASRSSWHGTHVAGTIAARTNNGVGVAGVAFNAKIVPVRVLGKCGGYSSDIADAIIWSSGGAVTGVPANANPARVINMSLGGGGACGSTTQNAINSARSRGTVVIVAAGNSGVDASGANPANCAGVVTVAATGRTGARASYSNFGAAVDVAAPGGDTGGGILSTLNAGTTTPAADSYASYQGTSMATPHVAGVAALMLSKTPGLTPDQIEATLKSTARAFPASCGGCGAGIVDAGRAVGAAVTPPPPPPPVPSGSNEVEPNNTTGSANAVTLSGTLMNGNMGSTSDSDYFVLQLPPGRTLSATLAMASSSADYDLYVYNSSGAQIGASENPAGQGDAVSVTNGGSATYARYVRVRYYSGGTGATNGRYTLKLSW